MFIAPFCCIAVQWCELMRLAIKAGYAYAGADVTASQFYLPRCEGEPQSSQPDTTDSHNPHPFPHNNPVTPGRDVTYTQEGPTPSTPLPGRYFENPITPGRDYDEPEPVENPITPGRDFDEPDPVEPAAKRTRLSFTPLALRRPHRNRRPRQAYSPEL